MNREQILSIIKFLEHVRKSPPMYFGDHYDTDDVSNFLLGFNIAYGITTGKSVPRFDPEGWEASYYKVPSPKPDRNIDEISVKD